MPKEFDCKACGMMIRGPDDRELVRAERYHMKEFHNQRISKDEALKNLQNAA